MTATDTNDSAASNGPYWQVPSLDREDRILGGVAAGIAHELGLDALWIRLGFVALFTAGGWGALCYVVAWGVLAQLEYQGLGPQRPPVPKGRTSRTRFAGTALAVFGLLVFFANRPGIPTPVVWPLGVACAGMVIAWRQLGSGTQATDRFRLVQVIGGLAAAVGGMALLLGAAFRFASTGTAIWAGLAAAVGLIVLSAPWWWRLVHELDAERQARIRSDERADLAAHLHDSVLQTLTLIQRHGDDPQMMRNLARRQERELRNWLDPSRADRGGRSVRGRLDELASDVEELHGVPVEVVVVGDCLVDEPLAAALAAAREAAVNAAKYSGADHVALYVEITDDNVEIFVRDTGVGFDRATVAIDRRGLVESIEGRMRRAGGSALITSEPGAGTEVEILLPRSPTLKRPRSNKP